MTVKVSTPGWNSRESAVSSPKCKSENPTKGPHVLNFFLKPSLSPRTGFQRLNCKALPQERLWRPQLPSNDADYRTQRPSTGLFCPPYLCMHVSAGRARLQPCHRAAAIEGFRGCVRTRIIQPRRGDLNLAQDAVRRTESWVGERERNSPAGTAETRGNGFSCSSGTRNPFLNTTQDCVLG